MLSLHVLIYNEAMVESKYNYYIQNGNDTICLNGISKAVFSVNKSSFDFIKVLLSDVDLQQQEEAITKELVRMRFLVEDNEQETNYLLENKRKDANSSLFHLILNPTQDCIFRCWYCYETHKKGEMSKTTLESLKKLIIKVLDREDIDKLMLGWFGGEPLMYFDEIVYPLSVFAKEEAEKRNKGFFCNMTSNGFLLTEEVAKKCTLIGLNTIQVTLDGDEKRHNKTRNMKGQPSFRKIIDNCVGYCLDTSNNRVLLRINYTDDTIRLDFAEILDIIPVGVRAQIEIQFKRVWQTYEKKTDKTPDGLLDNVENLKKKGFHLSCGMDFGFVEGCLCYADRNNYVNLNFDGKVYKCTAVDYNEKNALGYLSENGDIVWEDSIQHDLSLKPYVEDTKCMECNLLPICGGPCFRRKYESVAQNKDFCIKELLDTDVDMFVKQYYNDTLRKIERRRTLANI